MKNCVYMYIFIHKTFKYYHPKVTGQQLLTGLPTKDKLWHFVVLILDFRRVKKLPKQMWKFSLTLWIPQLGKETATGEPARRLVSHFGSRPVIGENQDVEQSS